MKKKRRLRKKRILLLIIIIILIVISISLITKKIKQNNYSNQEIKQINKLSEEEKNIILSSKHYNNLFKIIENENYKNNNLKKYLQLAHKYSNIDGIIKYVNDYENNNIKLNDITINLIAQKYFIIENLDRYLSYYKNNSNKSFNEIVKSINCNLDIKVYEDAKPADITKGMHTLVNKYYYLNEKYIPNDIINVSNEYTVYNAKLNKTAYENFVKMADDAKLDNANLKITTGYRDYHFQKILYDEYIKSDGKELADTYSARPGFSEHQLGYSIDLTNGDNVDFDNFEKTFEFEWLQKNAHKYGFIIRFPKGEENITGYKFESWHYRYVGEDIAKYIYENNITYEEYYAYFLR